jgi:uncharacterized protein (DUF1330 family)
MKKGYWVVAYRAIKDPAAAAAYSKLAGPIILRNGGKFVVRAPETMEVFEAGIKGRTVVVEFESYEKALALYRSDEYRVALDALGSGAERDFRVVEGAE